jgi:hypothetical protein
MKTRTSIGAPNVRHSPDVTTALALIRLEWTPPRLIAVTLAAFALLAAFASTATAQQRTDLVAQEGDIAHEADLARQQHFADPATAGAGVKVCVISDSNDDGNGALQRSKTLGAIPQNSTVLTDSNGVVQDGMSVPGATGEGLAMMEIIHRLAPGASIEFATGQNQIGDQTSMAKNIGALVAGGCHIVVDDVSFGDELPFQDDLVGKAVRDATARGVSYFSSVSNFGNMLSGNATAWEGDFVDGGPFPQNYSGRLHSFGSVNVRTVTEVPGTAAADKVTLSLRDPATNQAATFGNNYDLYLTDSSGRLISYKTGSWAESQQVIDLSTVPDHPKLVTGDKIYVLKQPQAAVRSYAVTTSGAKTSSSSNVRVDYLTVKAESGYDADTLSLFWNDPVTDPRSDVANQYDLYLADSAGNFLTYAGGASKAARQVMNLRYFPDHPKLKFGDRIYVLKQTSAADRFLHIDTSGAAISPSTSGRTRGHNASPAPFAYSIAAVAAPFPSAAFIASASVAAASADGPRGIYFEADGSAIPGGAMVLKPNFAAAEGVTTSFPAGNKLHFFNGSSAAAPHAAAIAALVLSKYPSMTQGQLRYVLTQSVLPSQSEGGTPAWNRFTGNGILMASKALDNAQRVDPTHFVAYPGGAMVLKDDGSVTGWPGISNVIAIFGGGRRFALLADRKLIDDTGRIVDENVVNVSAVGMVAFRRDGTARFLASQGQWGWTHHKIFPNFSTLQNVVGGAFDWLNGAVFLKHDGTLQSYSPHDGSFRALSKQNVIALSWLAYSEATVMLLGDGSVDNLGDGHVLQTNGVRDPIKYREDWAYVPKPSGVDNVLAIATGFTHVLALRKDGTVTAWGHNNKEQCNVPAGLTDVVGVAAYGFMSYALKSDGTVVSWGKPES